MKPRPDDYKMVDGRVQNARGVSVYNNVEKVKSRGWEAHRVGALPAALKVIQRGRDPEHFEIVPVTPMPLNEYEAALAEIELRPYEEKDG